MQEVPYSTRVAIDNLVNRYGRAMDAGREDEFLFLWHLNEACRLSVVQTEFVGSEGLSAFVKATHENFRFVKHWTANYDMVLAEDGSILGIGSAFAINVDNDNKTGLVSGTYTDKFVERDGRWAFQTRHVDMDIMVDVATGVPTLL
jgi:hypothetical protein